MATALAIPGLGVLEAQAESAPEQGVIGFKYLDYQDAQSTTLVPQHSGVAIPESDRIKVQSPSFYLLAPLNSSLSLESSVVLDSISGATPYYYNTLSGASKQGKMQDYRKAFDAKVTSYQDRSAIGVAASLSEEHDYRSRAISVDGRLYNDSNTTTYAAGIGVSKDSIQGHPGGLSQASLAGNRNTTDLMVGVTQVLTPIDLVQVNLTYSIGRGYFTDPYESYYGEDRRPDTRNQTAVLARWNHYFARYDSSLQLAYRYYSDTWGIAAHTFDGSWVQPLPERFTVTPSLRYYSQRAASFYLDPLTPYPSTSDNPYIQGLPDVTGLNYYSADTRLSAFGAFQVGFKVAKEFDHDVTADVKLEFYEARSEWRIGGSGSEGLLPFHYSAYQVGLSKKF